MGIPSHSVYEGRCAVPHERKSDRKEAGYGADSASLKELAAGVADWHVEPGVIAAIACSPNHRLDSFRCQIKCCAQFWWRLGHSPGVRILGSRYSLFGNIGVDTSKHFCTARLRRGQHVRQVTRQGNGTALRFYRSPCDSYAQLCQN